MFYCNFINETKRDFNKIWATGTRIKERKKLSQEELSFKADLHRTCIGMIECAEKNITLSNIEKIANALENKYRQLTKV
ncbi:MAG: hypothetical protein OHK0057_16600 [Thermoflexibacter sp.]